MQQETRPAWDESGVRQLVPYFEDFVSFALPCSLGAHILCDVRNQQIEPADSDVRSIVGVENGGLPRAKISYLTANAHRSMSIAAMPSATRTTCFRPHVLIMARVVGSPSSTATPFRCLLVGMIPRSV
jgi:hypothetical protein